MNVDYSQHMTWPKVTAPNGAVYYKVPDTGYLYDPFLSASKGRPVLFTDPSPQVADKQKAEAEIEKQRKQAERASSPLGQIAGLGGIVAGTVGAKYAVDALSPPTVAGVTPQGAVVMSDGAIKGAGAAAEAFSQGAAPIVNGVDTVAAGAMQTPVPAGYYESMGAAPEAGMFSPGGIGSAGNAILPAVGAVGAIDLFANKKHGAGGALQGAASGAAMGSYFGPVGAGVGAGIGAITGYFGNFGDVDRWKTEGDALRKLKDKGTFVPDDLIAAMPTKGRSKDELVKLAQELGGNVKFASSRDEGDLTGADIVNYSTFAKQDPDWFNKPLDQRISYAQQLLDAGAVREHHGTIDVDFTKASPGSTTTKGAGVAQIQPGTPAAAQAASVITSPQRTMTRSPGIGLDGRRLTSEEMGKMLANRMNGR